MLIRLYISADPSIDGTVVILFWKFWEYTDLGFYCMKSHKTYVLGSYYENECQCTLCIHNSLGGAVNVFSTILL